MLRSLSRYAGEARLELLRSAVEEMYTCMLFDQSPSQVLDLMWRLPKIPFARPDRRACMTICRDSPQCMEIE